LLLQKTHSTRSTLVGNMFTIVDDTEESFHVPILVCLQPLSIQSLKVPFLLPEKNKVEKDKCIETMG
jgi:hypothetical protein